MDMRWFACVHTCIPAKPHALKYPTYGSQSISRSSIVRRILSGTASETECILESAIVDAKSPRCSSNASEDERICGSRRHRRRSTIGHGGARGRIGGMLKLLIIARYTSIRHLNIHYLRAHLKQCQVQWQYAESGVCMRWIKVICQYAGEHS